MNHEVGVDFFDLLSYMLNLDVNMNRIILIFDDLYNSAHCKQTYYQQNINNHIIGFRTGLIEIDCNTRYHVFNTQVA